MANAPPLMNNAVNQYNHIDIAQLELIADGSKQMIIDLTAMFTRQSAIFSNQFEDLLVAKDYIALGKLAHKVKGSVSAVSISPLVEAMKFLEKYSELENEEECRKITELFKTITPQAIDELNHFIENF